MNYYVGQSAQFSKTITETDVYQFAGICGDFNPLHINSIAAEHSVFGKRVAHGALLSAMISTVIGMYLPGNGTIYLKQESCFKKPVYINDTVTAKVTIQEIRENGNAYLETCVLKQNDECAVSGTAVVRLPG